MKNNEIHGRHYINGTWIEGSGAPLVSYNPANSQPIWKGTMATKSEINAAYEAALNAQFNWGQLDIHTRVQCLKNFGLQIEENKAKLSQLISIETGKPRWEAATEVNSVIGKISISINAYYQRTNEAQVEVPDSRGYVRYKPQGVVAVLGPFNFPAHLSNGHIVPALLAGNTIVYKPSELSPAVAECIVQCWDKSSLPPGVLNCIQGDGTTAKLLLDKPLQGVFFTGSYQTGVAIHERFKSKPEVILALEMGGNNPLIIDTIENNNAALYHTLLSIYITSGQRCTCARRLMIPNNPFGDRFLNQLLSVTKSLKIGQFEESPEPFMGPVIGYTQALSLLKNQEELLTQGGEALLKMELLKENSGFLSPGIIEMTGAKNPKDEEIFAPLIQVYRYKDFEEAIHLANQTQYGLAAGFIGDSRVHYEEFFRHTRAGIINWNRPTTGAASNLPFGGVGRSGNQRPSAYFAADYCAYPIASLEQSDLTLPEKLLPGIQLLKATHEGI